MKYRISHTTTYQYGESVDLSHNQIRLKPRNFKGQKLLNYNLHVFPFPSESNDYIDFFGNNVTYFSVRIPQDQLIVTSESSIERKIENRDYTELSQNISLLKAKDLLTLTTDENLEAKSYLFDSKYINPSIDIKEYAKISLRNNRNLFEATQELMQRIYADFKFVPGFTTIATPLEQVFEQKKGVCQDFAHFAIACMRSIGIPARYMSGYIETIPPAGTEKLVGSDASHAWFSVLIPSVGWVDFDPTNNILVGTQHVTIGWGADYFDIIPVKGVIFGNGKSTLKVAVDMNRIG